MRGVEVRHSDRGDIGSSTKKANCSSSSNGSEKSMSTGKEERGGGRGRAEKDLLGVEGVLGVRAMSGM